MVIVFCAAVDVFGLRFAKIGWILRIHEGEREDFLTSQGVVGT